MSDDKDGGEVVDLTVTVLREIRDDIRGLRRDTNQRLDGVESAVRQLGNRIDNVLLGSFGDTVRRLDARVTDVEGRLDQIAPRRSS